MSIHDKLKPLKLVVNAGNGVAGLAIDALEPHLPFEFIEDPSRSRRHVPERHSQSDAAGKQASRRRRWLANSADMGIAWDGDFDRCFLFDENGAFIEGYYIVGLLAEAYFKNPDGNVVHDPRLTWNTLDVVAGGGEAVQSKPTSRLPFSRIQALS